jgi:sugar/nucleoside kinase (ribokinase family)
LAFSQIIDVRVIMNKKMLLRGERRMIDLYAVGDLSWLVFLPVPHIPLPGEILLVQGSERLLGNDAAVVALLTARQGLHSCLLTTNAISRRDGLPLLDLLRREDVDISQVNTDANITPVTYFLSRPGSDERAGLVEAYPFSSPAIDQLPASHFIYVDVYEEHIHERLALLKKLSTSNARCLVNLSASHLLEKAELLANIPSIEILQMRGSGDIKDACALGLHILQTCQARSVVVTLGEAGAVLVEQPDTYVIPAEVIEPVRTIGAGASFTTGFICALAQGKTHREAATLASKYAATFCTGEHNPIEVLKNE